MEGRYSDLDAFIDKYHCSLSREQEVQAWKEGRTWDIVRGNLTLILRMTASKYKGDLLPFIEDAFFFALQKATLAARHPKFRPDEYRFSTWMKLPVNTALKRMAKKEIAEMNGKSGYRTHLQQEGSQVVRGHTYDPVYEKELNEFLESVVSDIGPREAEIFLAWLKSGTARATVKSLGIPLHTVRNTVYRCKVEIARRLRFHPEFTKSPVVHEFIEEDKERRERISLLKHRRRKKSAENRRASATELTPAGAI